MTDRSAIVLVGGEARRAGGREKYFFQYDGKTFLEHLISSLGDVVDEIILVARNPDQCERFSGIPGISITSDIRKGIGPIGGIHAGVRQARGEFLFVVACDMPCVNALVVERLFTLIDAHDAVIPRWDEEMIEPLHAVYRRSGLLSYLRDHHSRSLREMVRHLDVTFIDIADLRALDPELRTFTNINAIEDLKAFIASIRRKKR
ncbi:MAG: molybdenum cofactor guanylyltransferase [Methanomicrobiaceae archaeon]|nr:molybdenum cofactor guanylyltransferase [Methanomicrobiaceae archaeon]